MSESNNQSRPVVSVAISPRLIDDRESLQRALIHLVQQDPTLRTQLGPTVGAATLCGMGEPHLEEICDRISQEYKIQLEIGRPQVIYLETIGRPSDAEGKYMRQIGGRGHYAHVRVRLEPRELGTGYQFASEMADAAIPTEFVESVNFGI